MTQDEESALAHPAISTDAERPQPSIFEGKLKGYQLKVWISYCALNEYVYLKEDINLKIALLHLAISTDAERPQPSIFEGQLKGYQLKV